MITTFTERATTKCQHALGRVDRNVSVVKFSLLNRFGVHLPHFVVERES